MLRPIACVPQPLLTETWTRTVPAKVAVHVIGVVPNTSTLLDPSVSVKKSPEFEEENE
jgi:hypothetical protein